MKGNQCPFPFGKSYRYEVDSSSTWFLASMRMIQIHSLSACLQTLDANEQLPQRLLGRYEVSVYGDEMLHRSLIYRLVLSLLALACIGYLLSRGRK
jgi:hypothetical protein